LDLWTQEGQQVDCQPLSPVDLPVVSSALRREVDLVLAKLHQELAGGADSRDDPRVQLLVAEVARRLLVDLVDEHQRGIAVGALVDGTGLSSLSRAIGLSPRTLGMRWGDRVEAEVAPLRWLRDHADEWASACRAAAAALSHRQIATVDRTLRADLLNLERADATAGWRGLRSTPASARHVLQAVNTESDPGEAVVRLAGLLVELDQAEPASQLERRSRRPPGG